ncbi:MAG: HlyD family efflux transporter periplasmic adaptor subunit [Acidobacteria bacterium]|nr:HlyD family efflux transporter periplasmic adaptor subunit [Acidobacteriota bacterium]
MPALTNPMPAPQPGPAPARPAIDRRGALLKLLLVLVLIVAASAAGYYAYKARQTEEQKAASVAATKTFTVQRGDLEVRLRVTGSTSASDYANIIAPRQRGPESGAMVLLKLVGSGVFVKKGDIIVEIDPQSAKDHLDDTLDGLKDQDNNVKKKKVNNDLQMTNLQQTLRQAKANVDKARLDIKAAEIRTDIDRELLKLSLDEAEAAYKEMQLDVPLSQQSQSSDLRNTELGRKTEVLHVERHQGDLDKYIVRAPMDGMAVLATMNRPGGETVTLAVGDTVRPGQQLMKIINPKRMQVDGTVNQSESSQIRIGQGAAVRLDAFPGTAYAAKVHSIGALAVGGGRQNYYIRTIPVLVYVDNADSKMIPDLSASADILLKTEKDAVLAPLAAVEADREKTYVYVRTAKNFERREVKLGADNGVQVAVLEGLKSGEVIKTN